MGKFQLKRAIHDFNMAWRKLVPPKWRLRVTEEDGIYTLWNAERKLYTAWGIQDMASTLMILNNLWAEELPA